MNRRALAVAAALVLPAAPAHAWGGGDATGFTCGLASVNDVTGLVGDTPIQAGVVWAGPALVPNYADDPALVDVDLARLVVDANPPGGDTGAATDAAVRCTIRESGYDVVTVDGPTGVVAANEAPVTYATSSPTADVYVCTEIRWDSGSDSYSSCDRARRVTEGNVVAYVLAPTLVHKIVRVS